MNLNYYNININPVGLTGSAAGRYRTQVAEHLRWIYQTTSGRILLNSIRRPNFPIETAARAIHECNAVGGGEVKPELSTQAVWSLIHHSSFLGLVRAARCRRVKTVAACGTKSCFTN